MLACGVNAFTLLQGGIGSEVCGAELPVWIQGREPSCLSDLNAQLRAWVWEVANQRLNRCNLFRLVGISS